MTICTPWRVADSLNRLLGQIDARSPGRSKASDGSIGDTPHQAEGCNSEHNSCCTRYLGIWIVRARDFTHDPAHGADMNQWAEALRASRDKRIRYLIWNRRITGPNHKNALGVWVWDPYDGDSPHTEHMHVSTFNDAARFDNTAPWAEPAAAVKPKGDEEVKMLVRFKDAANPNQVWLTDGLYRRDVTSMVTVAADGTASGPVSNGQIFQTGLLGPLANSGKVFVSAGNPNVWGIDIALLDDDLDVSLSDAQLAAFEASMTAELHKLADDPAVRAARVEDAFAGAQRAEAE